MHREGGEARRPTRPRLPAERPRALDRVGYAIVPVLVLLLESSLAHAQPLLRDEALLATFSGVELDALSRPTWTGTHAITRDGRCVSGTSVVTPMTAPAAVWAHPSSGTFFTATAPFGGRTAIYRNDCAPSSVLVEDFAGLATTMRAAPLVGGALVSHGEDLAVIAIPEPGGTLARVVLADATSVGSTLPPLTGAGISEVAVAIGRLSAPAEIDTIVFDAHRTWLETEPTGTEVRREEVWVLEVRVGEAPRVRVGPFAVRGMHALATDVPIRLTTTRTPDHLVIETRDEVLLAPRDAEALDPSELPARIARAAFAWPGGPPLAGLVPSPEGLAAIFEGSAQELHRVSIDLARADLDRDGLTGEEESALGTSDLSRDSDGDGFDDAVERSLATDPASATSQPPALPFEPNAVLAATGYLAMERPRGFDRSECILGRCWSTPGLADVACVREGAGPTRVCIDGADADAPMLEHYAVPSPTREHVFEPAEPITASSHPSRLRWRVRELATGATREVSPPAGVEYMQDPLPVSGDEAFFTIIDPASGAPVSIARWREGSTSVVLTREACARFVGERECGVAIVGHDRARDRLVAAVWSSDGAQIERTWLFLLEGADARYVGEITSALPAGASVVALHSLDSGGYVVTLRLADGNAPATAVRLDPYFRPAGTQPRVMASGIAPGMGRFRRGYVATDAISTLVVPPPSGNACIESRGAAVCFDTTPGGSSEPFLAPAIFPLEWQTVGDALAPGETIGFASRPLLTSYGLGFPADPTLFRVTREGAIAPWIDLARLRSLMDAPARAALEATPLFTDETRPVRTVAVSPDLTRICLADGQRTLELALERGRPSLVRLADDDAGEACAYDEDGRLAVIASAPHALRVDGTSYALPDGPVSELVRVGDTWVLARAGERALCLGDAASAPEETPVLAVGIAPFLSGIVWLDGEGQGHFAPDAASFCSGAPTDRLGPVGFDLWEQASLTSRIPGFLTVSDVALAVRGDGRVFAFPRLGEAEDAFPLVLAVSWFPRWEPVDGAGARALDTLRWRYDGAYEGVEVERLSSVAALSYAPGPGPDDDWGYRGRPGMRAAPTAGADAGAGFDAGTSPTAPPMGCACRVAPIHRGGVAGLALVGLALSWSIRSRRASRRWRGAAPR